MLLCGAFEAGAGGEGNDPCVCVATQRQFFRVGAARTREDGEEVWEERERERERERLRKKEEL